MPNEIDEILRIIDERIKYANEAYRGQEQTTVLINLNIIRQQITNVIYGEQDA